MTEDRRDEDEFEKVLRDSMDGKGTGKATENASWEGQEDVYTPSAHRPADATELRQKQGGDQSDGDHEWDRNIGSAVYAMKNKPVAEGDDTAPDPLSPSATNENDGSDIEGPRASPKQSEGPRSTPSQFGQRVNWGLHFVSVGAVIALATWLVLRDQQGLSRLSEVEQRLGNLEQYVVVDERDTENYEQMENRLINLETAMAELSLIASSPQPSEALMSPVEEEALQQQVSEQELQMEAFESRVSALEEGLSTQRKIVADTSKVQLHSGGNVPEAKKVAGGGWVINLITVSRAEYAEKLLAKYRNKGIEAEKFEINRDGKRLYRLRVGGFPTRAKAEGYAAEVRSKLGLKETWVTRR